MRIGDIRIIITLVFALVTLLTALRAAWLWRRASNRMPRLIEFIAGSQDHVVQIEAEAADAAALNSQAALWSGATAILSALTATWGAVIPFISW